MDVSSKSSKSSKPSKSVDLTRLDAHAKGDDTIIVFESTLKLSNSAEAREEKNEASLFGSLKLRNPSRPAESVYENVLSGVALSVIAESEVRDDVSVGSVNSSDSNTSIRFEGSMPPSPVRSIKSVKPTVSFKEEDAISVSSLPTKKSFKSILSLRSTKSFKTTGTVELADSSAAASPANGTENGAESVNSFTSTKKAAQEDGSVTETSIKSINFFENGEGSVAASIKSIKYTELLKSEIEGNGSLAEDSVKSTRSSTSVKSFVNDEGSVEVSIKSMESTEFLESPRDENGSVAGASVMPTNSFKSVKSSLSNDGYVAAVKSIKSSKSAEDCSVAVASVMSTKSCKSIKSLLNYGGSVVASVKSIKSIKSMQSATKSYILADDKSFKEDESWTASECTSSQLSESIKASASKKSTSDSVDDDDVVSVAVTARSTASLKSGKTGHSIKSTKSISSRKSTKLALLDMEAEDKKDSDQDNSSLSVKLNGLVQSNKSATDVAHALNVPGAIESVHLEDVHNCWEDDSSLLSLHTVRYGSITFRR